MLNGPALVKIRLFSPDDSDSVLKVQSSCKGVTAWQARDYEQLSRDPRGMFLVAESQDRNSREIVGFSACFCIETDAELWNIAVIPAHRRRGIARALLSEACKGLAETGVRRLFLEVRESNRPAMELYRSLGFASFARRKDYYQNPKEDALMLILKLTKPEF